MEVSAVVPTRNRSQLLPMTLRSVLRQADVRLEIVVVDDASIDDTRNVVAAFGDPRVRLIRNATPTGPSAARNRGAEEARGEWLAFVDDDDLWAPTKLAQQIEVMTSSGRRWSYAGDVAVDGDYRILSGGPPPRPEEVIRLLEQHDAVPAGASNVIVRADTLEAAGPFDPHLTSSEDWDMWIRLAQHGPPDWVCRPLVAISYHGANASRDAEAMMRQLETVAARYGIPVDRARHQRWVAWNALLEGRRVDAARNYLRAVALGDVGSLARATVAVAAPGYAIRRARPAAGERAWIAEARAWLDVLLEPSGEPCDPA
jgi:glycosyltransferase involved in cell wall biosynthesis